jgi:hypothetical protein
MKALNFRWLPVIVAQRLVGRGILPPPRVIPTPRSSYDGPEAQKPPPVVGGLYRRILLLPHQPQGLAQQVQAAAKGFLHEPNFVVKHGPRWLLRLVLFRHGRIVVATGRESGAGNRTPTVAYCSS